MICRLSEQCGCSSRDTRPYHRQFSCRRTFRTAWHRPFVQRIKLGANIILFADKNELPGRRVVGVAEKVVYAKPEIVELEFRDVVAIHLERIEIVLIEVFPVVVALLIFSPEKSSAEQDYGSNDRCENVSCDVAAKFS